MQDEKWSTGDVWHYYSRRTVEITSDDFYGSVADVSVIDWIDGDVENGPGRIPGPATMARARAIAAVPEMLALLSEIWERRATTNELGHGYGVHLDASLCDRIKDMLERVAGSK